MVSVEDDELLDDDLEFCGSGDPPGGGPPPPPPPPPGGAGPGHGGIKHGAGATVGPPGPPPPPPAFVEVGLSDPCFCADFDAAAADLDDFAASCDFDLAADFDAFDAD